MKDTPTTRSRPISEHARREHGVMTRLEQAVARAIPKKPSRSSKLRAWLLANPDKGAYVGAKRFKLSQTVADKIRRELVEAGLVPRLQGVAKEEA